MTFSERLDLRDLLNLIAALVLIALQSIGIGAAPSYAQDMMRRDSGMSRGGRMDDGGGMRRGGGAIGTGIGIGVGVGIGQALTQHPPVATQPEVREPTRRAKRSKKEEVSKKKPSRSDSETKTTAKTPELKFVGKPDVVLHNPLQKDGKLGDLNDHKQVVISRDDSYFTRHYYYTRDGDKRDWFYYDVLVDSKDPLIAKLKDVKTCSLNDDNCDGPPPIIEVDDKPVGGVQIVEDEKDCPGGFVRVNVVTTKCVDNRVHYVDDHYNYCPPDKINFHHVRTDTATGTACGEGGATATPGPQWTPPGLDDLHGKGCGVQTDTGRVIERADDVGGEWVITVWHVYTCSAFPGKEFVGDPETVKGGKVSAGSPKPPLDPNKLSPPEPM